MEKLPELFPLHEVMAKVPPEERTPYVIVAFQECERMNFLIAEMRRSLRELDLGLKVTYTNCNLRQLFAYNRRQMKWLSNVIQGHRTNQMVDGTNQKLVYELLLMVYSNFRCITHRFRDTSCFNAENHIFVYTPLVFDLEVEGHAVAIWRQNLSPEN